MIAEEYKLKGTNVQHFSKEYKDFHCYQKKMLHMQSWKCMSYEESGMEETPAVMN